MKKLLYITLTVLVSVLSAQSCKSLVLELTKKSGDGINRQSKVERGSTLSSADLMEFYKIPWTLDQISGIRMGYINVFGLTVEMAIVNGKTENAYGTAYTYKEFKRNLKKLNISYESMEAANAWYEILSSSKVVEIIIIDTKAFEQSDFNQFAKIELKTNNMAVHNLLYSLRKIETSQILTSSDVELKQRAKKLSVTKAFNEADYQEDNYAFFRNFPKKDLALSQDADPTLVGAVVIDQAMAGSGKKMMEVSMNIDDCAKKRTKNTQPKFESGTNAVSKGVHSSAYHDSSSSVSEAIKKVVMLIL